MGLPPEYGPAFPHWLASQQFNAQQQQQGLGNGYWNPASQIYSNSPNGTGATGNLHGANQVAIGACPLPGTSPNGTGESSGVKFGEITAYRMWEIADEFSPFKHPRLKSVTMANIWEPGNPMEGSPGHGVGVFCWKDKDLAEYEARMYSVMDRMAWGSIKIWGEVHEHQTGYRAQYAKIEKIEGVFIGREPAKPQGFWGRFFEQESPSLKLLNSLRETYGVAA